MIKNEYTTDEYISESILRTKIANARKSSGLTQSELSDKSGLSKSCISNIEKRDSNVAPTVHSVIKYLEALGYRLTIIKTGEKIDEQ